MKGRLAGNCIFVFALLLGLLAAAARSFLRPKEINYYENRYAVQYPAFSAAGALDSSPLWTAVKDLLCLALLGVCIAMLLSSSFNPFVYFRF